MTGNEEQDQNQSGSFGDMTFDPGFFNMDDSKVESDVEIIEQEDLSEFNTGQEETNTEVEEDNSSEETEENTSPSSDIKDDSSLVAVLGNDLYERGAISSYDKEEIDKIIAEKGEAEAARHIITSEIEASKNKVKETYDTDVQEYLRLRDAGFEPQVATQNIAAKEGLSSITDEVLLGDDGQRVIESLMTNLMKETTQMDDKAIKEYVDYKLSMSPDDGLTEAKAAKGQLLNIVGQKERAFIQNQEQARIARDQEIEVHKQDLKKTIESSTEFIKDIPVNNAVKDKMYSILTDTAGEIEGRPVNQITLARSKDPKNFDIRMAYALATGYFDADKPWSKIVKTSQTKAASNLESYLSSTKSTSNNNTSTKQADPFDKWVKRH